MNDSHSTPVPARWLVFDASTARPHWALLTLTVPSDILPADAAADGALTPDALAWLHEQLGYAAVLDPAPALVWRVRMPR